MRLPTRPVTHLIVRQTGFAFASLNTLFNAMLGFGHSSKFPNWGIRRRVREVIIHLHHLLLVAVTVADDHQHLLIAWLTPMGSRQHTSFDGLNHQGTFTAIAYVDSVPGLFTKRLTPGLNALPGSPGPTTLTAILRGLGFQITHGRVRRDRQQVALTQGGKSTPKPIRSPHLVVTANPAMRQPGTIFGQQLQGQLVTRAIGPVGFGNTGFVQAGFVFGPFFGQKKPLVHQGVALSGDVAQIHGHLAVVDFAQTPTPLSGHTDRLTAGLRKSEGSNTSTPSPCQMRLDLMSQRKPQGLIVHSSQPMKACKGRRECKPIGNRFNVFAFKVQQKPTDIGFGVLIAYLTLKDGDEELHKAVKTWRRARNLRGNLTRQAWRLRMAYLANRPVMGTSRTQKFKQEVAQARKDSELKSVIFDTSGCS